MRLQHLSSSAPGVTDDRGKHNRTIDIASPTTARGGRRRFQDAAHILRDAETDWRLFRGRVGPRKLRNDIRFQRSTVNVARVEHSNGVAIVAKRSQQMFKCNIGRPGGSGKLRPPRQRCAEVRRHRDLTKICGSHAHGISKRSGRPRPHG
jgi:hypothetical protein